MGRLDGLGRREEQVKGTHELGRRNEQRSGERRKRGERREERGDRREKREEAMLQKASVRVCDCETVRL